MQRNNKRKTWRSHLLVGLVLLGFCGGCAGRSVTAETLCPQPSDPEVDEYELLVESGDYPRVADWTGRLVAYCWPRIADLVREEDG